MYKHLKIQPETFVIPVSTRGVLVTTLRNPTEFCSVIFFTLGNHE